MHSAKPESSITNSITAGETKVSPALTTIQGQGTHAFRLGDTSTIDRSSFLEFVVMGFVEYDTLSHGAHASSPALMSGEISTGDVGGECSHVTQLLVDWQRGDKLALDQLMPIVYRELRKVAASYLKGERPDHTLQPTALIHESYVRMVEQDMPAWESRAHFFGVASRLMRQILVDHARSRRASKRAGDQVRVPFEEALTVCVESERLLTLDTALNKLCELDERKTRIVEMRLFGGMTLADIAIALDVSEPTIKRDLRMVKAWLRIELGS